MALPLRSFDPNDGVECDEKDNRDIKWVMTIIPLMALIAEAIMITFLWIRRICFLELNVPRPRRPPAPDEYLADAWIDDPNACTIAGGLVAGILSLAIHL